MCDVSIGVPPFGDVACPLLSRISPSVYQRCGDAHNPFYQPVVVLPRDQAPLRDPMVGDWARGWHTYDRCRFWYRFGWVVEVSHYMRLRPIDSKRATQVVNETPSSSIIRAVGFSNAFSYTSQYHSGGTGSPFLCVGFPRISRRLVDPAFENDVRFCDAGHGRPPDHPHGT